MTVNDGFCELVLREYYFEGLVTSESVECPGGGDEDDNYYDNQNKPPGDSTRAILVARAPELSSSSAVHV